MRKLVLINPYCPEFSKRERLEKILSYALDGYSCTEIGTAEEMAQIDLRGSRILFTVSLGESGINMHLFEIMKYLRLNRTALEGSVAGVLIDGNCEFYTKSTARSLVFTANRAGCAFPGRPLVEGTRTLKNYNIQAQNLNTDNMGAYMEAARILVNNITEYSFEKKARPKILALSAGNQHRSNTMALWDMVKSNLDMCDIKEISLRNGQITDCRGCSYQTCLHFGEEGSCFYGGPIVEQVYPAILECDALVMIGPNYNDALGGNLTAFINRMTALFTKHRFYDKLLFGVIVSGYSGSDIVAEQLISGLNMNKTFALPGRFAIMETANNPGEILVSEGVRERAAVFAQNIKEHMVLQKTGDRL